MSQKYDQINPMEFTMHHIIKCISSNDMKTLKLIHKKVKIDPDVIYTACCSHQRYDFMKYIRKKYNVSIQTIKNEFKKASLNGDIILMNLIYNKEKKKLNNNITNNFYTDIFSESFNSIVISWLLSKNVYINKIILKSKLDQTIFSNIDIFKAILNSNKLNAYTCTKRIHTLIPFLISQYNYDIIKFVCDYHKLHYKYISTYIPKNLNMEILINPANIILKYIDNIDYNHKIPKIFNIIANYIKYDIILELFIKHCMKGNIEKAQMYYNGAKIKIPKYIFNESPENIIEWLNDLSINSSCIYNNNI